MLLSPTLYPKPDTLDSHETICLDYNATTPIEPGVAAAMLPCILEHFGNPSSSHAYSVEARIITSAFEHPADTPEPLDAE